MGSTAPHTLHTRSLIQISEFVPLGVAKENLRRPDVRDCLAGEQIKRTIFFEVMIVEAFVPPPKSELEGHSEGLVLRSDIGKGDDLEQKLDGQGLSLCDVWRWNDRTVPWRYSHQGARCLVT